LACDTGERALLDLDVDGWVRSIPPTAAAPRYDRVATRCSPAAATPPAPTSSRMTAMG